MPLYVADYLADTQHLTTIEHGAYNLLIMHYWRHGGLPGDDRQLRAIAKMTPTQWRRHRSTLAAFFVDWKHKRIDIEIAKADAKQKLRQEAGKRGGNAKANAVANAKQNPSNALASSSQPDKNSEAKASAADAAGSQLFEPVDEDSRAKLFRIGKTILISFGVTERRTGGLIGQWLKAQDDPDGLLAALQFARDRNVAEPVAYVSALIHGKPQGAVNGFDRKPGESLGQLCTRLAAEARKLEAAAGLGRADDAFRGH